MTHKEIRNRAAALCREYREQARKDIGGRLPDGSLAPPTKAQEIYGYAYAAGVSVRTKHWGDAEYCLGKAEELIRAA